MCRCCVLFALSFRHYPTLLFRTATRQQDASDLLMAAVGRLMILARSETNCASLGGTEEVIVVSWQAVDGRSGH
jgi:hypothetical protein